MEFQIIYYKDKDGKALVEELLIKLKIANNPLAQQAFKGLDKIRNRAYHREPLSKYVEPGLWELRIRSDTDILRILYTFTKGRIIILLHIFIKKQQRIPTNELEMARKRLKEVKEREVI